MNKNFRYVLVFFVLASMLLGACAGAAPSVASDGGKVEASSIAYTGTIESINGNQWVVNGQMITVDPSVVKDGPFNVGDLVKVEVKIAQDGTVAVTRVEIPSQDDISQLPGLGDDNSNDANSNDVNGNDANSNDVNGNESNGNDDNSNNANGNDSNSNGGNGNGDNSNGGNEVFGVVEAIGTTSVTVNGQTYEFQSGVEIKGLIQVGDFVKIHLVQNADGTFSVREMEMSDPTQVGNGNDDNGNDSNSNDGNGNDDNGNDNSNSSDDNGNGGGGNDNGGGNGNDDGGNDNSGGGNGNDDGGGNDNGGNGNG